MSFEKTLQSNIVRLLTDEGAYAANIHGNEFQAGVPDILACYRGSFIGLEVKGPNGALSPIQKRHLRTIQLAGGIGEEVRSIEKVKDILHSIRTGTPWNNTQY